MNNYLIQTNFNNIGSLSEARSTARAMLAAAGQEAEQIITAANQEAKEIVAKAQIEYAEVAERLEIKQRISTLFAWRTAVQTANEDLFTIVEYLAKAILVKELSQTPESILNRIELVTEIIGIFTKATLEISESDLAYFKDRVGELNSGLTLKINKSLSQGEFILKTKRSEIRSSPFYHLEKLILELKNLTPSVKQLAKSIDLNRSNNES